MINRKIHVDICSTFVPPTIGNNSHYSLIPYTFFAQMRIFEYHRKRVKIRYKSYIRDSILQKIIPAVSSFSLFLPLLPSSLYHNFPLFIWRSPVFYSALAIPKGESDFYSASLINGTPAGRLLLRDRYIGTISGLFSIRNDTPGALSNMCLWSL